VKRPTSPPQRLPIRGAGYWLYLLHLWTLAGLAISNLFLGLAGVSLLWSRKARSLDWRRVRPVLLPVALYVAATVAAVVGSLELGTSLGHVRELLTLATLVLGLVLLRGEARVRLAIDGFVVVAALLALMGLGQLALNGGGDLLHRIRGPFSHYMTFAGVLLLADLLLIAQLLCGRARSLWRWLALAAINVALLGTLTRSAWVAFALALTLLVLLRAPRLILAYLPAAALFLWLAPATVSARVLSTFDVRNVTNYDRLCMVDAGLRMVRRHPLFGLGPGMVQRTYPLYRHPNAPRQNVPHLHNSVLQIAAEKGLIALAAYLWLLGGALVLTARRYRSGLATHDPRADIYLGVFAALLAFVLAGVFEDNWRDTEVQRVALFLLAVPYGLRGGEGGAPGDAGS